MNVKPRDLGMTPLDDLFSTDESRAEAQLEKVIKLNPAEISDFPNHPFKVKQDDDMAEMVESIKKYGVLVPALVRPKEDGGYEMVAGHRRKFAASLAGVSEIPCIVRSLTDDEATIVMVDSNLQREKILPSEKAFAYSRSFVADRDSRIAILSIGYADGYPRILSCGKSYVLINGHQAPVVGKICMDLLAVDVTDCPDVTVGSIATLIGNDGNEEISAPTVADNSESITNELLSRMGRRLKVIHKD